MSQPYRFVALLTIPMRKQPLSIMTTLFLLVSCTTENQTPIELEPMEDVVETIPSDSNEEDGTTMISTLQDVERFYTPELVDSLETLGFLFRLGDTPPIIEGAYQVTPFVLQASLVPTDSIGSQFADQIITFSNQDNTALTIDFKIEGGSQTTVGSGSFISGTDNQFSVFLITQSRTDESVLVDTTVSITGIVTAEGIENLQFAGLMLDDKGDPDDLYISNNTGRLIVDQDSISPRIEPSGKTWQSINSQTVF